MFALLLCLTLAADSVCQQGDGWYCTEAGASFYYLCDPSFQGQMPCPATTYCRSVGKHTDTTRLCVTADEVERDPTPSDSSSSTTSPSSSATSNSDPLADFLNRPILIRCPNSKYLSVANGTWAVCDSTAPRKAAQFVIEVIDTPYVDQTTKEPILRHAIRDFEGKYLWINGYVLSGWNDRTSFLARVDPLPQPDGSVFFNFLGGKWFLEADGRVVLTTGWLPESEPLVHFELVLPH